MEETVLPVLWTEIRGGVVQLSPPTTTGRVPTTIPELEITDFIVTLLNKLLDSP